MAETATAASPARARSAQRTRSAQRRRPLLGLAASAALAIGGAVVVPVAAQAADAETPSFTATVTEVPDDRIDIAIEGTGYGDVPALPGQSEPHAYFTLVEKGADLADVTQDQAAISAGIDASGNVSGILPIPAENLDASAEYEVISWPSRSNPTAETLYARTDITIDWAALFPAAVPTWDPQLTVTPATGLNPEGDTVAVTGAGYNPAQGLYVFACEDVELPADLWQLALGCRDGAALVTPADDGTFELEFTVEQLNEGATAVYTAANHTAQADRTQDAKAPLAFAAPEPPQSVTPTFTAEVTEVPDERIDIAIAGSGYGDVPALPGQAEPHAYFTLIEKDADLSDVTETQSAISATVDAEGNVSDVLSIPADELDASTAYEVISWPSRSFPSDANLYARADVTIDWAALFPEAPQPEEPQPEEPQPEEPVLTPAEPGGTDDDGAGSSNGAGSNRIGSNSAAGVSTAGDDTAGLTGAGPSATGELAATGAGGAEIALSAAALLMLLGGGVLVWARHRARAAVES